MYASYTLLNTYKSYKFILLLKPGGYIYIICWELGKGYECTNCTCVSFLSDNVNQYNNQTEKP